MTESQCFQKFSCDVVMEDWASASAGEDLGYATSFQEGKRKHVCRRRAGGKQRRNVRHRTGWRTEQATICDGKGAGQGHRVREQF